MIATITRFSGLWTTPNPESAPPGSFKQCNNLVIRRADEIEPRRSYQLYSAVPPPSMQSNIFGYQNRVHGLTSGGGLYYDSDGAGTFVRVGSAPYTQQDASDPFESMEAGGSLFFSTATGVQKLDQLGGTVRLAGIPRALDLSYTLSANASGFLANNCACAYRVIWGYVDAQKRTVLGAPSTRLVVWNDSGSAANVTITASVPSAIKNDPNVTGFFLMAFRTKTVTPATNSADGTDATGDAMGLVYENNLTGAVSTVTFTDICLDVMRGADLYTNPMQALAPGAPQGVLGAALQPPLAARLALFKNTAWYGNTVSKHRLSAQMIGLPTFYTVQSIASAGGNSWNVTLGTSLGFGAPANAYISLRGCTSAGNNGTFPVTALNGTVVTITNAAGVAQVGAAGSAIFADILLAGQRYYASFDTESVANRTFIASDKDASGNPYTSSQQIGYATASLLRVVNGDASQTVAAFSTSGPDDPPGKVLFEEIAIGGAAFTLTSDFAGYDTQWAPNLAGSAGTLLTSSNDAAVSRVFYSDYGVFEAVPALNYFDIGDKQKKVLRLIATRDSLFVFKEDGLFRISGDAGVWTVTSFDPTVFLYSPPAAAVLKNRIFALTAAGPYSISEAGAVPKGEQIKDSLGITGLSGSAHAVANEQDGMFYLSAPGGQFAYCVYTDRWATEDNQFSVFRGAYVGGYLYRGTYVNGTNNISGIYRDDRSSWKTAADRHVLVLHNPPLSGTTLQVDTIYGPNPAVGDVVQANSGAPPFANFTVASFTPGSPALITFSGTQPTGGQFATGNAYHYAPISTTLELNPFTAGNVAAEKHFSEANVILDQASQIAAPALGFYSDIDQSTESASQPNVALRFVRSWVPRAKQFCRELSLIFTDAETLKWFAIKAISFVFEPVDEAEEVEQ